MIGIEEERIVVKGKEEKKFSGLQSFLLVGAVLELILTGKKGTKLYDEEIVVKRNGNSFEVLEGKKTLGGFSKGNFLEVAKEFVLIRREPTGIKDFAEFVGISKEVFIRKKPLTKKDLRLLSRFLHVPARSRQPKTIHLETESLGNLRISYFFPEPEIALITVSRRDKFIVSVQTLLSIWFACLVFGSEK